MIRYEIGGRYYHDQGGDEYALTPAEWRRLQKAKRSIRFYGEDGVPVTIRLQSRDEQASLTEKE